MIRTIIPFAISLVLFGSACNKGGSQIYHFFENGSVDFDKGFGIAPNVKLVSNHKIIRCSFTIFTYQNNNGKIDPEEIRYEKELKFENKAERSREVVIPGERFDIEKNDGTLRYIYKVVIETDDIKNTEAIFSFSGILKNFLRSGKGWDP